MLDRPGKPIQDGKGTWYSSRNAMYVLLTYKTMVKNQMKAEDIQAIDMHEYLRDAAWFDPKKVHGQFGRVKFFCKKWSCIEFTKYIEQEKIKQQHHQTTKVALALRTGTLGTTQVPPVKKPSITPGPYVMVKGFGGYRITGTNKITIAWIAENEDKPRKLNYAERRANADFILAALQAAQGSLLPPSDLRKKGTKDKGYKEYGGTEACPSRKTEVHS